VQFRLANHVAQFAVCKKWDEDNPGNVSQRQDASCTSAAELGDSLCYGSMMEIAKHEFFYCMQNQYLLNPD